VKLTTHLYLVVPRSKNAWSYTFTPPIHLHGVVLNDSTGATLPVYVKVGLKNKVILTVD